MTICDLFSLSAYAHCDDECNEATNIALHRHAHVGQSRRQGAGAGAGREWKTSHGWLTVFMSRLAVSLSGT